MPSDKPHGVDWRVPVRSYDRSVALQRQARIVGEVLAERRRQDEKWGEQNHGDLTWLSILVEEVGELAKACIPKGVGGHVDEANLDEECRHVAAVAVAWMEARARR